MEGAFDRIFSIASFEHVHTLGLALEKMHAALAPGGKLFTMFSPWHKNKLKVKTRYHARENFKLAACRT